MSTQFALRPLDPRFLLPNALFLRQDLSSAGHGVAPGEEQSVILCRDFAGNHATVRLLFWYC